MPRIRGEFIPAEDLPYGPGNPDYEYDAARQEKLDDEQEAAAKRAASGISPEVLSLQDAFLAGQKSGHLGHGASMNPYQHGVPEHAEWERGRMGALGQLVRRIA